MIDSQRETPIRGTHQRESIPTKRNLNERETVDNIKEGLWSPPTRRNRITKKTGSQAIVLPELEIRNRFYILESLEKDKTMEDAGVFEMRKDITMKC